MPMNDFKVTTIAILSLLLLLNVVSAQQAIVSDEDAPLSYWYTGSSSDLNYEDEWIPFFSLTDAPNSLPLRGFISDSRNYFFDFGAFNWLSDWVESIYGWPVPDYEKGVNDTELVEQLVYLFENATRRLERPVNNVDIDRNYSAVDYVKDFDAPFEAFVPLVVMYGFNEIYDESNVREWIINTDTIESCLNEAFPLIEWTAKLYWFNYDNATEFADLMSEKTQDVRVMIDDDFLNRSDTIIHDIISSDPLYYSADMVLPALIMLQHNTLWSTYYDAAVGGLGRLDSIYPEIDTWCLNGRSVYSYFYGGHPDSPRIDITTTVIHELGHCVGQTDIHSEFGWLAASSCMSVMAAYQQTTCFDRFDMDLINNAQALQLWGRYQDEIDYFEEFSLSSSQQDNLEALEGSLSNTPEFLRLYDYSQLQALFYNAEQILDNLSSELSEPRKSDNWSENSPTLDVHIDWIVGPGFPAADELAAAIEASIDATRVVVTCEGTLLPSPQYNLTIGVHSTSENYNDKVLQFWGSHLTEANTSLYSEDDVPEDAWSTMPRNRIFLNHSGYAVDGFTIEDWLTENPFTPEIAGTLHYRFYIMNLENISLVEPSTYAGLIPYLIIGVGIIGIAAIVIIQYKRLK